MNLIVPAHRSSSFPDSSFPHRSHRSREGVSLNDSPFLIVPSSFPRSHRSAFTPLGVMRTTRDDISPNTRPASSMRGNGHRDPSQRILRRSKPLPVRRDKYVHVGPGRCLGDSLARSNAPFSSSMRGRLHVAQHVLRRVLRGTQPIAAFESIDIERNAR